MAPGTVRRAVHLVSSTTFAGVERHVINLAVTMQELGWRSAVGCRGGADELRAEARLRGVTVLSLRSPSDADRQLTGAVQEIRGWRPSVLFAHDGRACVLGVIIAALLRVPVVRTQHFLAPASLTRSGIRGWASLALHRRLNRRLAGYISVSAAVRDAAWARGEIGSVPCEVIPPAFMLPPEDTVRRAAAGRGEPGTRLIFLGRLEGERRLDLLVRAMPIIRRRRADVSLRLVGRGRHSGALRQLARSLSVEDSITYTDWVSDPYEVLADADVYVNTWPDEAFGMSMAEAMALGLPVVAPDAGASPELVIPGRTGALFRAGDSSDLAGTILDLIDTPGRARQAGANARELATGLGAARSSERTIAFVERLLAG